MDGWIVAWAQNGQGFMASFVIIKAEFETMGITIFDIGKYEIFEDDEVSLTESAYEEEYEENIEENYEETIEEKIAE